MGVMLSALTWPTDNDDVEQTVEQPINDKKGRVTSTPIAATTSPTTTTTITGSISMRDDNDLMAVIMSSLTNALSSVWPIDVIDIVARYARSKSLVAIGGTSPGVPLYTCVSINPYLYRSLGSHHDGQLWRLLPSLPHAGVIQQHVWNYQHQLVIPHQTGGRKMITLTWNDDTPLTVSSSSSSSSSSSLLLSMIDDPNLDFKRATRESTDGINWSSEWKSTDLLPSFQFGQPQCEASNGYIYRWCATYGGYFDHHRDYRFQKVPVMSVDRALPGICVWRDRIYLIGLISLSLTFFVHLFRSHLRLLQLIDCPTGSDAGGGSHHIKKNWTYTNRISCLDTSNNQWMDVPDGGAVKRRTTPLLLNLGHHIGILVLLALDNDDTVHTTIELFQPHNNHTWLTLQLKLPFAVDRFSVDHVRGLYVDDGIICIGNSSPDIWAIYIGETMERVQSCRVTDWFKLPTHPIPDIFCPRFVAV
jgi:hypothetical protein